MSTEKTADELKQVIVNALDDLKAVDIVVLPVSHLTSITDYMVIASATSDRHAKALANNVSTEVKNLELPIKSEGESEGDWILLDAGDVVTHIMLPKTRAFYNLEGLWQDNAD